ncbi:exodeoxyribonuclease VII small subunit [Sphingobacterium sp. UGAL515B_05]|uniref:exodeoxyribonuclease VII small subunit n=1 Tax=Sphingobacterium sp. UGAL515B_05 TaxID=2986767 RepID=UPI0029541463|nr:exodeoxyribonuclease VII small subunit [Sphingobacterium sp. UGAL515B_05]WON96230.1 exodeoxyribonuclease VII small subunit [Sphingobacterium sp. UGAL515B_05]
MEQNYTYTDAFNELQTIVKEIENGTTNIDELAGKIRRASDLIQVCKAKLTATEDEVNSLLQKISPAQETDDDESLN